MLPAMRKNPLALSAKGGVVLYFVMAFEVLVMISPFAAFFYAVMNPILLFLTGGPPRAGSPPSSCPT
jgi:hypothetical protein